MASNKPTIIKMSAPLGVAAWPKLTAPDYGNNTFPKPEGEYSVKMLWKTDDPDFIEFKEALEAYMPAVEAMANQKFSELKKPQRDKLGAPSQNPLFSIVYDKDDEPTGDIEAKFTMRASGIVKKGPREGQTWKRHPALFDAFGRPFKKGIDIWGGSELVIAFSFQEDGYFIPGTGSYGIKLQLEAAQVVTLRQGGEQSAAAFGFGKHEGGFDVSSYADADDDDEGGDQASDEDVAGTAGADY